MIDWGHWHNEPHLVGGLVLLGWLWAILAGPLRARLCTASGIAPPPRMPRSHAWRFYTGLTVFYLAVGSPLDQIAENYLLSAHMLQHELLIYPAAILFLWGIPHWMIDPFLEPPAVRGFVRFLTRPVIAALIFIAVVGAWHAPIFYSAALNNRAIHIGEHVMFFGAALIYWWPLLSPSKLLPPASHATQMLYLVGVIIGMMPIHAYIIFTHDILYPTYEYAPRIIASLSPKDDQLLAGVMMQIITIAGSIIAFGFTFYRWYEAGERRATLSKPKPTAPLARHRA